MSYMYVIPNSHIKSAGFFLLSVVAFCMCMCMYEIENVAVGRRHLDTCTFMVVRRTQWVIQKVQRVGKPQRVAGFHLYK